MVCLGEVSHHLFCGCAVHISYHLPFLSMTNIDKYVHIYMNSKLTWLRVTCSCLPVLLSNIVLSSKVRVVIVVLHFLESLHGNSCLGYSERWCTWHWKEYRGSGTWLQQLQVSRVQHQCWSCWTVLWKFLCGSIFMEGQPFVFTVYFFVDGQSWRTSSTFRSLFYEINFRRLGK